MTNTWNPWHGCKKVSEGCKNCYVYDRDGAYGRDASVVAKTKDFDLPLRLDRSGNYKLADGARVYVCMTTDFFIDEADEWREEVWEFIRRRHLVHFSIFTKRVERIGLCLPKDWGDGYSNVTLICSVENQKQCVRRLPIFKEIPAKHKMIACAPFLEQIQLEPFLDDTIELVSACGENGQNARVCNFDWVISLKRQCENKNVPFHFSKTGTFLIVSGKKYFIPYAKQAEQAHKANIDFLYK